MPIATLVLSANACREGNECFFGRTIVGDTGISVGDAPRLAVTHCYNESCAESVVDTTGVVVDGATVPAELSTFRLVRTHPTWRYEARWPAEMARFPPTTASGRHAMTIEVQDEETGEFLFRVRYEVTRSSDGSDVDACRPEITIADVAPQAVRD